MEKTMSVEDKIRRAEEIYYRRRQGEEPIKEEIKSSKNEKKDIKLFKKLIKQIIVCLLIYAVFYTIVNNNYIFSEDFTNKVKEILAQDINIREIYSFVSDKFNEVFKTKEIEEKTKEDNNIEQETQMENETQDIQNNNENIGGAEEILTKETQNVENTEFQTNEEYITEVLQTEIEAPLSQMEQDANYIKSTINFIKPVNGVISSMYGERNPTTPSVPKNHTGTDIAAEIGTKIVSATNGKVILTSSKGDYGKHIKIQINGVIIVYAHCNKIYVKEGDVITQGQEIAEVGNTGNTTGPHLHFEIRYQDRYIDPQMILEL